MVDIYKHMMEFNQSGDKINIDSETGGLSRGEEFDLDQEVKEEKQS